MTGYHRARPDDSPEPGDRCKDCGRQITWTGPGLTDWDHSGGQMIAVCILWNTEADGSVVEPWDMELDDIPKCYYGPFDNLEAAMEWMNGEYPDGDTDVYDMMADVYDVPDGAVNSPFLIHEDSVAPVPTEEIPQEIQGT